MSRIIAASSGSKDIDGHDCMLLGRPLHVTQAMYRKSSYSSYNGACVGVAVLRDDLIGVRDTKEDHDGNRVLIFSKADWCAFLDGLKRQ